MQQPVSQTRWFFCWWPKIPPIFKEAVQPRRLPNFGKANKFVFVTITTFLFSQICLVKLIFSLKHVWINYGGNNNFVRLVVSASCGVHMSINEVLGKTMLFWCDHRQKLELAKSCCVFLFSSPKTENILSKQNRPLCGNFPGVYQTQAESVSSGYPNAEKRVKNTTRREVFLTKLEVFG